MLLVVSHRGQSVTQGFFETRIQLCNGLLIHRDLPKRGGIRGMGCGEQWLVKGLVHWGKNRHQVRGLSTYGRKGISGHRSGVNMPGVWSDDCHHLAREFRQLSPIKVLINRARKRSGVTFVPPARQRRRTNRCDRCHMCLLVRYYFSTEGP